MDERRQCVGEWGVVGGVECLCVCVCVRVCVPLSVCVCVYVCVCEIKAHCGDLLRTSVLVFLVSTQV